MFDPHAFGDHASEVSNDHVVRVRTRTLMDHDSREDLPHGGVVGL